MPTTRSHRRQPSRIHPAPAAGMHRCLHILEILRVIIDGLNPETDAGTLLHMGLACRAFFDPAMDVLWRKLSDPRFLVGVLYNNIRAIFGKGGQLKLVKRPTEAQWRRFDAYARRVEVLEDTDDAANRQNERFSSVDWVSFMKYFGGSQILPNLRSYTLGNHGDPTTNEVERGYATLFTKPPLRQFKLWCFEINALEPLFDAITSCYGTLETFAVHPLCWGDPDNTGYDVDILNDLSRAMFELPALVSLDVPLLLPCAFKHLATLPNLRELHFTIDDMDADPPALPLTFPVLERLVLTVRIDDPFPPTAFLLQLVAPVLHDLAFHYDFGNHPFAGIDDTGPPTMEYMEDLLDAVSTLRSLRSFELDCWSDRATGDTNVVDITELFPLMPLVDLERLDFRRVPVDLASDDLELMARAWPKMQCLRLGDLWRKDEAREPHHLDIGDLLAYARLFPNLTTLGLPVWIRGPSTRPSADLPPYKPLPALKELFVAEIDNDFSVDAVAALAKIFPNAEVKRGMWRYYENKQVLHRLNERKVLFVQELLDVDASGDDGNADEQ